MSSSKLNIDVKDFNIDFYRSLLEKVENG